MRRFNRCKNMCHAAELKSYGEEKRKKSKQIQVEDSTEETIESSSK